MTRARPWLTALAYVGATLGVLVLAAILVSSRLPDDAESAVLLLGAALLVAGVGRLVHRAVRRH